MRGCDADHTPNMRCTIPEPAPRQPIASFSSCAGLTGIRPSGRRLPGPRRARRGKMEPAFPSLALAPEHAVDFVHRLLATGVVALVVGVARLVHGLGDRA